MNRFLTFWLLLSLAVDAPAQAFSNPLQASATAEFSGIFSDGSLRVELSGRDTHYTGYITSQGQRYPLRAARGGNLLRGRFSKGRQHFTFTSHLQGEELVLISGDTEYRLQRERFAPPFPLQDSLLGDDYAALSIRTGLELHQFVAGLRYWLSGIVTDQQALFMVEAHLLPGAGRLRADLEQLASFLRTAQRRLSLSALEQQGLRELAELSHKGMVFFRDWEILLQKMLDLYGADQKAQLQRLARSRLPLAVKAGVAYTHDFSVLLRAAGHISSLQAQRRATAASLAPNSLLEWETLHNMSETMREGMDMFKAWRRRQRR